MNNSLSKLEQNAENQKTTLNSLTKNSKDFQNKINKLLKEVDENIKKKEKEKAKNKSKENFKNSTKMNATQSNFRSRNDKHLLEFKTKKLNKITRDILNKSTTRLNTLNNSKIIEEKPKKNNKIENIMNKTQRNFRNNYKTGPSTPTRKKDKKSEIIKNSNIKEKEEKYKTLTNTVNNNKTRKIISEKNFHGLKKSISKSFSTNPLENNTEKIDKKTINKTKTKFFNLKKDIKGALFKNIKKEFNKLENQLNIIEEKDEKNDKKDKNKNKKNENINNSKNNKDDKNIKKEKNIPVDKKIKEQEETIEKQKEKISKLSEELRNYKKDNRKGIYIIRQDKTVHISKNLITINDEMVILIKCEPLKYYDSFYYNTNYEIDKLKSKEIYVDNKKLEDNGYEIEDKYNFKINYENTFNDETRKIRVILEIPNQFSYYSSYELSFNKKDVLLKYEIKADDDIQIDDVTNEYFKINKAANWVCFEGKTTNEFIVKPGSVIYSKKIDYQIYKYIPEFKNKEYEIIKKKETNNKITINTLAKYKKVVITDYGQEVEDLYKIKISNFPSYNYIPNFTYGLLLDTKYEIELVELNGEKVEYLDEKASIKITNFGAYKNQFAELHFKYKYFNKKENTTSRTETIITSDIKNSFCKLIIQIPDNYVVLGTNDIFPKNPSNNNEYIFNGISKEDKLTEFARLSTKKGEWDIQKEITLKAKQNIEKCSFKTDRMFKGGNLEIESYEIKKENAEFIEDLKDNKYIFNYNNLNTNEVKIECNVKAKNSTANYIFDGNKELIIKIPKEDKKFFKDLSDKILKEDKSNFPNYKKLGKWVYNYMTYNLSYTGRTMTAREIYDKKIGVCEHYSLLYNTLLTSQGIKVVKITGYALENNKEEDNNIDNIQSNPNTLDDRRHAWSLALIDGVWVPLDATWNLFEKNIPLSHIFHNYGDSINSTVSYNDNTVTTDITKETIKQIKIN